MCGIAGLVLKSPLPIDGEWLYFMSESLAHRGPDDNGILTFSEGRIVVRRVGSASRKIETPYSAEVALVHRRLSILDLSKGGWQPMGTPDGQYYIVFNGEIYNFLELRNELKDLGHQFNSRSDTEVLLVAYAQWGSQVFNRLVGMFAFAILDLKRRVVFLARDFFGIKPLYYTLWRDGFAFASEIKMLLDLPGIHRRVNPQRLYDYLRFGMTDHGEETLFADIYQIPAAHYMEIALKNPFSARPIRYWQVDSSRRMELSFDQAADRLRELFCENIRLHLRSDVPVGAALSGGIDSSSIVMAMRHLRPDLEIHTFSYIADNPSLSEEHWIDIVGKKANAIVHKVSPAPKDIVADLDQLVGLQEESFGGPSVYAQRRVFERAHEMGIKVMLDGQGADELLGGYHYYIAARLGSLIRQGKWVAAVSLLNGAGQLPGLSTLQLWLETMDFLIPVGIQVPLRRCIRKDFMPPWLNFSWFQKNAVRSRSLGYRQGRGKEVLKGTLFYTLTESSLPHLLRYEDRNSMAFSIESRVPFLTPNFVNFMFALPEEYLVASDGTTKAVFRKAMRGLVPDVILDRRDKIGFATPEMDWLITLRPWVESLLRSEAARTIRAVHIEKVQQEWAAILRGKRLFDSRVWRWLNLIAWTQRFGVHIE